MGESVQNYSEDDRLALGQAALSLLADWGLNGEQQIVMLGLDANHPASLDLLMRGAPLPQDEDVLERASRFLNLSLVLNALHGYESSRLKNWMLEAHEDLGNHTPYKFICDYGVTGLAWLEDLLSQKHVSQGSLEIEYSAAG